MIKPLPGQEKLFSAPECDPPFAVRSMQDLRKAKSLMNKRRAALANARADLDMAMATEASESRIRELEKVVKRKEELFSKGERELTQALVNGRAAVKEGF